MNRRCITALTTGLVLLFTCKSSTAAEWDHVHLTVTDTGAAARWYAKHFGSKPTKAGRFDAVVFGTTTVKFKQGVPDFKGSAGSSVEHIGFSVRDVAATIKQLETDGAKPIAPARYLESAKLHYGFVEDPWGTRIEILDDNKLLGFHHVHLKVGDRETAAAWFAATFGGKVTDYRGLPNLSAIAYGDMWLMLSETKAPVVSNHNRAVDHIGWKVADLDALVARLRAENVKIVLEPLVSGNVKLAFIESPSLVKIEVQEVLDENKE